MKRLFLISITLCSFVINVFAQAPTQKDILETPNTHLVEDYNYNTSKKTPLKISQKWFTLQNSDFKHVDTDEFEFDSNSLKITEWKNKSANEMYDYWTVYNYAYKNNLLQEIIISVKGIDKEKTSYSYDSNNRLISLNTIFKIFIRTINFSYPSNTSIIKKSKKNDTKTNELLEDQTIKFTIENQLITKKVVDESYVGKEYITAYKCESKGVLEEESPYETFLGSFMPSSEPTIGYKHNDFGHLISKTAIASFEDMQLFDYEYIYDDYNNWIAKFKIWEKDIFDSNSKVTTEGKLRTITYSDQTTTGITSLDDTKILEYLNRKKFTKSKPPNEGVYWSKQNNTSIKLYKNGEAITGNLNYANIVGNDFYVNDSISNTLYQFKNFKEKPVLKKFYKATVFVEKDDAVWYKNEKGSFWLLVNGKYIKNLEALYSTTDKTNRIINISNIPSYVLFYNDSNPFVMQKAISFKEYLKTHPNEGKEQTTENIPSGAVWKKADNGGFWFYVNGENRSQKISYHFFGNHCVIYDPIDQKSYLLYNIKIIVVDNNFINVKVLEGNIFWYKSDKEAFDFIINAQKISYTVKAEYSQNGIDVFTFNKNNQKEYVLKEYKNMPLFNLQPVENYTNYAESPTTSNLDYEALKNCNDETKCFANLFNQKAASILSDATINNKASVIATYMETIYTINPSMLQKVGMTMETSYLDLYIKGKDLLPQEIQDDIVRRSRQMLEDYNDYMNSKEVRDKVKENGGSIILNKN